MLTTNIGKPCSIQQLPGFRTLTWLQSQHALDERQEVLLFLSTQRSGEAGHFP